MENNISATVTNEQLERIIYSYHWDPFEVLGYHEVQLNNKNISIIRAFIPGAKDIHIIFNKKYLTKKMKRIHDVGFFEIIFDEVTGKDYKFKITNYDEHSWEQNDPYKFGTYLTDFDIHLLCEGNHFKSYEKLGAHIIEHEGQKGVVFCVWAPNAKRVSVIGDFNNWDGRRHQMRVRGTSGLWEIFIPDLGEGEIYKFEIKTSNDMILEKSDPYAFYAELRPKTGSIVYQVGKYKWHDNKFLKKRQKTNLYNSPISIYEVHLGSWRRKDGNKMLSYKELADELVKYVVDMGYTHIELMPVQEHPFDGSWGYQVTGYYAPTSRFGTPDEFCYFVDQCHQNGIGVIMDWVPAHFPSDGHGLAYFDGTALYEHADPRKGYHKEWSTLIFNYGRNEVRNFLISNALYWFEYFHIDGLRVDAVASMLYLDYSREDGDWVANEYGGNENLEAIGFLRKLNEQVYAEYPDVLMIAEESTAWGGVSKPTYLGGLGFGFKWNMGWMNDFLVYMSKDPVFRKYHHGTLTFSMIYAYSENFILVLSHDENVHGKCSLLNKMPGDDWQKFANLRASIGFMYTHPGKKLLFMGSEIGHWREWHENGSLDWHLLEYQRHQVLQHYFKELNRIYKENPALYELDFNQKGFDWINCNDWEHSIISFIRKGKNEKDSILVVINFTPVIKNDYRVGVPFLCHWDEILNSDAEIFGGSGVGNMGGFWSDDLKWDNQLYSLNLTLPPLAILIFKPGHEEKK